MLSDTADENGNDRGPLPGRAAAEDRRRLVGRRGEDLAAAHLRRLDFTLLARNVRTRRGEIDIIAFDGSVLAFVEVKTRRVVNHAKRARSDQQPLPWLGARQRARLRALASVWLADDSNRRPTAKSIRFDAIGVVLDRHDRLLRLDHLEGAW